LRAELRAANALHIARGGDGNHAVAEMERAAAILPREPTFRAEAGRLLLGAGRPDLALPQYERAATLEPTNLSFVISYARQLAAAGRATEAEVWYQRAHVLEPYHPDLKLELARVYLQLNRPDDAARLLREVVAVRPTDDAVLLALADVRWLQGDGDAAERLYDQVLRPKTTSVDFPLYYQVADVWMRRKQPVRAIHVLDQLHALNPGEGQIMIKLGDAFLAAGDKAKAIIRYERALAIYWRTYNYPKIDEVQQTLRRLGVTPPRPE
jgi:tetratricopeptide (TPR) repeat protein